MNHFKDVPVEADTRIYGQEEIQLIEHGQHERHREYVHWDSLDSTSG